MTYLGFEKLLHVWVFQEVPSVFLLAWKPRSVCWVKAAGLQLSGPAGGEALVSVTLCSPSLQLLPTFHHILSTDNLGAVPPPS